MIRDPKEELNKVTDEGIYFYTSRFYVFDNFSACSVNIWDKRFPTAEHAYQWKKFSTLNPKIAEQIFNATNPSQVKTISDAHKDKVLPEFHDTKVEVMEEIIRAKTDQHEKVKRMLDESKGKTIYENSPTDNFWGIGPEGEGENTLGKIWMKIRDEI